MAVLTSRRRGVSARDPSEIRELENVKVYRKRRCVEK